MKEKVIKYKKKRKGKIVCALKHSLWESELSVVTLELKGLVVDKMYRNFYKKIYME